MYFSSMASSIHSFPPKVPPCLHACPSADDGRDEASPVEGVDDGGVHVRLLLVVEEHVRRHEVACVLRGRAIEVLLDEGLTKAEPLC